MSKLKQYVFTDYNNEFHPFIVRALNEKHAKKRFGNYLERSGVNEVSIAVDEFLCQQAEVI